jgi:Prolyl oligopeptidase family
LVNPDRKGGGVILRVTPMLRLLAPLMLATAAFGQPPANPTPKTFPPDAATLKKIQDKTAELKAAVTDKTSPDETVYLKAAEWIVRHGEWYSEKSAQQTLDVLDAGLKRVKEKEPSWRKVRGKPIACGYISSVDGSVQPYSIRYPDNYEPRTRYRLDIILHGRDATLTEVKFLHAKETAKPGKPLDHFEVEVYGRGNNAYRWAGETDVFEAMQAANKDLKFDSDRIVLRGFSMGGAGTWHIGLRHPFTFAVLGPGAGFTTTREYIGAAKFGKQPDYIEKCLHIYDAVDYAENVFNVPVVAYSGEKDKQKLAADLIEAKLNDFKEPHSFTHLVAPGLEHKQPPEWMAKLETEYQKHLKEVRLEPLERFRFVTYTPDYMDYHRMWIVPVAPLKQYEKAMVDAKYADGKATVETVNVRSLQILLPRMLGKKVLTVDGQNVPSEQDLFPGLLEKVDGKWLVPEKDKPIKGYFSHGPIDDAFKKRFTVVKPTEKPWHEESANFAEARHQEFAGNWSRYFRGEFLMTKPTDPFARTSSVLFGDPQSNPEIAKILPKLPIKWTKDELVVNGVKYDPKTHLPVLIYPNPLDSEHYVVINSGHTFREADLKGTNALLYPRLGDWAVLKPKPTKDDPAGFEVVAAGLFDENWQFEKKK